MEGQRQVSQQSSHSNIETSFFKTCFNGLNVLTGVGILSVPYAVSQGGWLSFTLLFIVAMSCWYTGLLIQRLMDGHPEIKSYPDIGELSFGYKGRIIVALLIYLELYLVAIEFLILEGDNLEKLFPNLKLKLAFLQISGRRGFVFLSALIILPTTWLRSLGYLAYLSIGGVVSSIVLIGCVLWVGKVDGVGFHERGQLLENWRGLPTALSLFTFCYCGHAVFPTLRNYMQDKSKFYKVLIVCFVTGTITYGSMAIIGYMMFGNNLNSQVTLNLPTEKISTKIAIYTTIINPFAKYAVLTSPIANAIEDTLSFPKRKFIFILIRTGIVVSTVVVALFVPFFGYIMAFIGSFSGVAVSLLLPCLCYLKINRSARQFGLELILILGILLTAIFIGVFGTYNSVSQIVNHM